LIFAKKLAGLTSFLCAEISLQRRKTLFLQKNDQMDFVLSLPYLALLIWVLPRILFIKQTEISAPAIRILFTLKAFVGVGLILLYTYYYPKGSSDTFNYFRDGEILFSTLFHNPVDYFRMLTGIQGDTPHLMYYYDEMNFWLKDFNYNLFNDNRTVIRFNALLMPFSFGNIYVHTYVMNFLAFLGLMGIYRFFRQMLHFPQLISLIAVALPPSLLFWGSGLLKEGIVLFALGMFLFGLQGINTHRTKIFPWLLLVLSVALFGISKFYVLLALIPGIISWQLAAKRKIITYVGIHVLLLAAIFILPLTGFFPDIPDIISRKQNDFINYAQSLSHVGSLIDTPRLSSDFVSFMYNAVRGFIITLFRPHVAEVHNAAIIPAVIENLITITLLLLSLIFRNKKQSINALLLCASFTLVLFSLAGMTTPVLGALVRYKIPAQPFLYALLLSNINWQQINEKIKHNALINNIFKHISQFCFKSQQPTTSTK
jgi:hypothetical protein